MKLRFFERIDGTKVLQYSGPWGDWHDVDLVKEISELREQSSAKREAKIHREFTAYPREFYIEDHGNGVMTVVTGACSGNAKLIRVREVLE